jgi:hypothetical protein
MKRWISLAVVMALVTGWMNVGMAKSDILDQILKKTLPIPGQDKGQPQPSPAPSSGGTVYIKLVTGEVFAVQASGEDLSQVEFQGVLKLDQPDGTYYVNSAQVAYIKVPTQR